MDTKNKNKNPSKTLEKELEQRSSKPSWQSSNEGVHERVNFDDTLWGFELAGGVYYDTPLRVTKVKRDSRAERAGIQVGDVLQSMNGIETSSLTVQEAHDIILEAGIHIKLELYAHDVLETMYNVYQDELTDEANDHDKYQHLKQSVMNLGYKGAKTNEAWSIIWPCNKKRDILYKESNCFLVPSANEKKQRGRLLKNETMEKE